MESSTAADFPHRDVRRSRAGLFENNLMSVAFDGCLGVTTRAKPCKGMMGIIEEGEEVMQEGKKMEDAAADLSLIAAAQRVAAICRPSLWLAPALAIRAPEISGSA